MLGHHDLQPRAGQRLANGRERRDKVNGVAQETQIEHQHTGLGWNQIEKLRAGSRHECNGLWVVCRLRL